APEVLLQRAALEKGVRIVEGRDHFLEDAEQLFRGSAVRDPRPILPVDLSPIDAAKRKERVVLEVRPPEEIKVHLRRVGNRLAEGLGRPIEAVEPHRGRGVREADETRIRRFRTRYDESNR